ncbi:hypothetical protein D6C92_01757 [Aureobasidium pullulans]|nr:hypothetical protein D6C92_01757 [Aureobasidium pullulans]
MLLLGTVTADDLKRSVGDDMDAVQHAMAGICLRSSNEKKAVPLLLNPSICFEFQRCLRRPPLPGRTTLDDNVVIIEARWLPEDHEWRLLSMRRLAQTYMELEKIRNLEDAVSLLQKVMQRGRKTLHTDPQELAITEAMLADARDTLAKTLQLQSRDQILGSASALMRWACREITSRAAIMF